MKSQEFDRVEIGPEMIGKLCNYHRRRLGVPHPIKLKITRRKSGLASAHERAITYPISMIGQHWAAVIGLAIHEVCHFGAWWIGSSGGHGPAFRRLEQQELAHWGLRGQYAKAYIHCYIYKGKGVCDGWGHPLNDFQVGEKVYYGDDPVIIHRINRQSVQVMSTGLMPYKSRCSPTFLSHTPGKKGNDLSRSSSPNPPAEIGKRLLQLDGVCRGLVEIRPAPKVSRPVLKLWRRWRLRTFEGDVYELQSPEPMSRQRARYRITWDMDIHPDDVQRIWYLK